MTTDAEAIGPIDFILIELDPDKVRGEAAAAVLDLVESGIIRLFDVALLAKDLDGNVAALDLADVEPKPGGLLLHIRCSKTDQDAAAQVVAIADGQHAATDPVAALDNWLTHRGHELGPLFTSMRNKTITGERLSGNAIARMLRNRAEQGGLPAERITPHSLRAGHATTAAVAGVSLDRIAAQTRHKRLSTLLERYIRPAQALDYTSSKDLGL